MLINLNEKFHFIHHSLRERINKNILLILSFSCLLNTVSFSQNPSSYHFTENDGLPAQEIYHIKQDKKGFIWLATVAGLFRYNGYEFKPYTNTLQIGSSASLIKEDSVGTIWVTNFAGQIFYVENDSLTIFQPWKEFPKETSYIDIEVSKNVLYIQEKNNIHQYDLVKNEWRKVYTIGEKSGPKRSIHKELNGSITWLLSRNDQYIIGELENDKAVKCKIESGSYSPSNIGEHSILFPIKQSEIRKTFVRVGNSLKAIKGIDYRNIIDIKSIGENRFWVMGFNGAKEYVLNKEFEATELRHILPNKKVTDLLYDTEGNYWFTTLKNGLYLIKNLDFLKFDHPSIEVGARLVTKNNKGNFIFGLNSCGIAEFTENGQFVDHIPINNKNETQSIYYDENQNALLVGCTNTFAIKNKDTKLINELVNIKDYTSLDQDHVVCISGFDINIYNYETNDSKRSIIPEFMSRMPKKKYNRLGRDFRANQLLITKGVHEEKNLWIGYSDDLYQSSKEGFQKVQYKGIPIQATHLLAGNENELWVSTVKRGIIKIKGDEVIEHFDTKNSDLPSNTVNALRKDENYLWAATTKGLAQYDLTAKKWTIINKQKGLIADRILDIGLSKDHLVVVSSNGIQRIPKKIDLTNNTSPPIYITDFLVGEKQVPLQDGQMFSYDENDVTFKFVGLSYRSQGRFTYQYRIKSSNENWISLPSINNVVRFTKLNAGSYNFEIKAINENGIESIYPASLSFIIDKPFWQKWWFYLTILGFVIGTTSLLFWLRIRQINHRNRLEFERNNAQQTLLRTQMNPHFIFNSMNAIQHYLFKKDVQETSQYLGMFSTLMRQILEHSRSEYISLADEVNILTNYLELQQIRFEGLLSYEIILDEELDEDYMGIPPMFAQPFIENSLEHGLFKVPDRRNHIKVSFKRISQETINLIIDDTGVGIQEKKPTATHNSLATKITNERLDIFKTTSKEEISILVENIITDKGQIEGLHVNLRLPIMLMEPI